MAWSRNSQAWMYLIYGLLSMQASFVCPDDSLCPVKLDTVYGGLTVDCRATDMTVGDIPKQVYQNVTTLILSSRDIYVIVNGMFSNFTSLRRLDCSFCGLILLQVDGLKGLQELDVLNLSSNYLKIVDHLFPSGFFRHVPKLRFLDIGSNHNNGSSDSYTNYIDIFSALPGLIKLSIDSFSNLRIGEEFTAFKNLESLTIVCFHMDRISNDSFKGFKRSTVRHIELFWGQVKQSHLGYMLFQYLPNVTSISIRYLAIGNHNLLKMLEPLQDRQFYSIQFIGVGLNTLDDGILRGNDTFFLKNVCVSHFEWLESGIIAAKSNIMFSKLWSNCLKSIKVNIQHSEFFYTSATWSALCYLRKLEYFSISPLAIMGQNHIKLSAKHRGQRDRLKTGFRSPVKTEVSSKRGQVYETYCASTKRKKLVMDTLKKLLNHSRGNESVRTIDKNNIGETHDLESINQKVGDYILKDTTIIFPRFLDTLIVDASISLVIDNVNFVPNNLKSVTFRNFNMNGIEIKGTISGLEHLEELDISNTNLDGDPGVFKVLKRLTQLRMSNSISDHKDAAKFIARIVENVPNLETLDISSNNLHRLPSEMFHKNNKLKFLFLASNHFSGIPFDLKHTLELTVLDLTGNSIVTLSDTDIGALDGHLALVPFFFLELRHNQISCGCSGFDFIDWILRHHSNLFEDWDESFPCVSESGVMVTTDYYKDIIFLWRQCEGDFYFLVSFVFASGLMALYLAVFIGMKHKHQILSKAMQVMVPGFQVLTRKDFTYDVAIGYADQDVDYVRNVLLRYLEGELCLKTFVHQRDMLQDPLMMHTAIRCSWRTVLLITERFLHHYDMAHTVMKVATFFSNPSNPRSVLVMVEESMEHQIPDYVLQVVDDDNIFVLPQLQDFGPYEAKMLKTRLL